MTHQNAVDALKATRAADSQAKREAVREALVEAVSEGGAVSLSGIASRAGVSRQFLYSHPDLKSAIEDAARVPARRTTRPASNGDLEQGLRATHGVLTAKVERQRTTIAELRARVADLEAQRKRWLGRQLDQQAAVDPLEHADLRAAADRLMDDNTALKRKVSELERLNSIHESDLAAVRQALAEALAEERDSVVSLHGKRPAGRPEQRS